MPSSSLSPVVSGWTRAQFVALFQAVRQFHDNPESETQTQSGPGSGPGSKSTDGSHNGIHNSSSRKRPALVRRPRKSLLKRWARYLRMESTMDSVAHQIRAICDRYGEGEDALVSAERDIDRLVELSNTTGTQPNDDRSMSRIATADANPTQLVRPETDLGSLFPSSNPSNPSNPSNQSNLSTTSKLSSHPSKLSTPSIPSIPSTECPPDSQVGFEDLVRWLQLVEDRLSAAHLPASMIDRETQIDTLTSILNRTVENRESQSILCCGPRGSGKLTAVLFAMRQCARRFSAISSTLLSSSPSSPSSTTSAKSTSFESFSSDYCTEMDRDIILQRNSIVQSSTISGFQSSSSSSSSSLSKPTYVDVDDVNDVDAIAPSSETIRTNGLTHHSISDSNSDPDSDPDLKLKNADHRVVPTSSSTPIVASVNGSRSAGWSLLRDLDWADSSRLALMNYFRNDSAGSLFYPVIIDGQEITDDPCFVRSILVKLNICHGDFGYSERQVFREGKTLLPMILKWRFRRTNQPVVIVLQDFDVVAVHGKRTLYTLFDLVQSTELVIAIIGLTTRVNAVDFLEKRVKSRFSHYQVVFPPLSSRDKLQQLWRVALELPPIQHPRFTEIYGPLYAIKMYSLKGLCVSLLDSLEKNSELTTRLQYHLAHGKPYAFWQNALLRVVKRCTELAVSASAQRRRELVDLQSMADNTNPNSNSNQKLKPVTVGRGSGSVMADDSSDEDLPLSSLSSHAKGDLVGSDALVNPLRFALSNIFQPDQFLTEFKANASTCLLPATVYLKDLSIAELSIVIALFRLTIRAADRSGRSTMDGSGANQSALPSSSSSSSSSSSNVTATNSISNSNHPNQRPPPTPLRSSQSKASSERSDFDNDHGNGDSVSSLYRNGSQNSQRNLSESSSVAMNPAEALLNNSTNSNSISTSSAAAADDAEAEADIAGNTTMDIGNGAGIDILVPVMKRKRGRPKKAFSGSGGSSLAGPARSASADDSRRKRAKTAPVSQSGSNSGGSRFTATTYVREEIVPSFSFTQVYAHYVSAATGGHADRVRPVMSARDQFTSRLPMYPYDVMLKSLERLVDLQIIGIGPALIGQMEGSFISRVETRPLILKLVPQQVLDLIRGIESCPTALKKWALQWLD